MSCNIIRGHVAEGLKLAEAERLPHAIRQFIPEHHGTQQIAYFFNRAKEQNPEGTVNEADYCYGGPKPQTKEAAVLMLADSVESASHVLQDPTPSRIREMVERIVSQKMDEGQLDEAPLTLREITIVEETLTSVLSGMYHHRIDYPTGAVPAAKGAAPSGATGGVRA
jgi:membrane-associated HD superfamily phosphohydrolase